MARKPRSKRNYERETRKAPSRSLTRRRFLVGAAATVGLATAYALSRNRRPPERPPIEGRAAQTSANLANKRIEVVFQFGGHDTSSDARGFEPLINKFKPHVVCLESGLQEESKALQLEDDFYVHPSPGNDFEQIVYKTLVRHGRPKVFFLERFTSNDSRKLKSILLNSFQKEQEGLAFFFEGKPFDALKKYREALELTSTIDSIREAEIKKVISKLHAHLLSRFSDFVNEDPLRVVIRYGSVHTPIYVHALKSGFSRVTREISTPTYFNPVHAFARRFTFGLTPRNTPLEIARVLLARYLSGYAKNFLNVNFNNSNAFGNILVSNLSLEQFKRISYNVGSDPRARGTDAPLVMAKILSKEGIRCPISREDVHKFLRIRGIPLAFN